MSRKRKTIRLTEDAACQECGAMFTRYVYFGMDKYRMAKTCGKEQCVLSARRKARGGDRMMRADLPISDS